MNVEEHDVSALKGVRIVKLVNDVIRGDLTDWLYKIRSVVPTPKSALG